MCGIVGFSGHHSAAPILLEGLSKLEYRGYDSAGIAVRDADKDPVVVKEEPKNCPSFIFALNELRIFLDKSSQYHSFTRPLICLLFLLSSLSVSTPSTTPINRIPRLGKS